MQINSQEFEKNWVWSIQDTITLQFCHISELQPI